MARSPISPGVYNTVDPARLEATLDPARYTSRSHAFDEIIAAAERHYWNPEDQRYIDYSPPLDLLERPLLPAAFTPEILSAVGDRFTGSRRVEFANELARFQLSQLLHGEQGGVAALANLCLIFEDAGSQEYASTQLREETRHVRALTRYFAARWGAPVTCGTAVSALMTELALTPEIYRKIVGMQIMLEGMALGAYSTIQAATPDPVLARLLQLILTDEAYHHKFGKIWGLETVPHLNEEQHRKVESWAAGCFLTLIRNLFEGEQKRQIYERFGLDLPWVAAALRESFNGGPAARAVAESNRMFRVLVKTLLDTGIVTSRTRPIYRNWFDLDKLAAESSDHEDLAERTTAELADINRQGHRKY